jgi:hypothetical protein
LSRDHAGFEHQVRRMLWISFSCQKRENRFGFPCQALSGVRQEKHTAGFCADLLMRAAGGHADEVSGKSCDTCIIDYTSFQHVALLCVSMFMGGINRSWLHSDQQRFLSEQRTYLDSREGQSPPWRIVGTHQFHSVLGGLRLRRCRCDAVQ